MMPLRASRSWLAIALSLFAVVGVACSSNHAAAPAKVIFDKGTPFADLLVPKLTSSVTDGAVGVTVDAPVTVSVADGVLAAVSMVNDNGRAISGQLSPNDCAGPPPNSSAVELPKQTKALWGLRRRPAK